MDKIRGKSVDKTTSSVDKMCQETDCAERMAGLNSEQKELFKSFTYCPHCAEEMALICSGCHEQLTSSGFKFCPWCGSEFTS